MVHIQQIMLHDNTALHARYSTNSTVISQPCKIEEASSQKASYVKHTSAVNTRYQIATAHLYKYT